MFQRIRRAYERTVDLFVSPSEFLKRMMLAGGWRIPFEVVPNAVRVANSGRSAPSAEGGYFLFAGRLVREKGVDELVQAAAQLKVPVVVAGDGPLRSELESRNGGARFVGHVDADALGELMRCALCCVVPSTALENAPMSVLEPMAAGVPVIASDVGGVSEIIADGRTGLLVPPGDPSALAAAMSSVLADPDWAEGIGAAARALVTESYSPERHLRLLLSSYERVLDR
jgi:glycosyltransferase involved in cell wall biosynthesis